VQLLFIPEDPAKLCYLSCIENPLRFQSEPPDSVYHQRAFICSS
jgi:hypothetical protein